MSLSEYRVGVAVPVSDLVKAKEFYEGALGLSAGKEHDDGSTNNFCADRTEIHPYPSPANAGKSGATLAFWNVDNIEEVVDDLSSRGVGFEQYDMDPIKTNGVGIADLPDGNRVAWFKDPDGNILSIGTRL